MAITYSTFFDSLRHAVTDYYTVKYSTDTELFNFLSMYAKEFESGSLAVDVVRGNTFLVTCDTSKLYNNFGVYFNQNKHFDQEYDEDKYIHESGSAATLPIPAVYTPYSRGIRNRWELFSRSPGTLNTSNFAYSLQITRNAGDTYSGVDLTQATMYDQKLYSTCFISDSTSGSVHRLIEYNPAMNYWRPIYTGAIEEDWALVSGSQEFRNNQLLLPMGPIAYSDYYNKQNYTDHSLYCFDVEVRSSWIDSSYSSTDTPYLKLLRYSDIYSLDANNHVTSYSISLDNSLYLNPTTLAEISYTDSVIQHDKIYMAMAARPQTLVGETSTAYAPNITQRWPFLFCYDPNTGSLTEKGLALEYAELITGTDGLAGYDGGTPETGALITGIATLVDSIKNDSSGGSTIMSLNPGSIPSIGINLGEVKQIDQFIIYDSSPESPGGLHPAYQGLTVYKSSDNSSWYEVQAFNTNLRAGGAFGAVGTTILQFSGSHTAQYFKAYAHDGAFRGPAYFGFDHTLINITEIEVRSTVYPATDQSVDAIAAHNNSVYVDLSYYEPSVYWTKKFNPPHSTGTTDRDIVYAFEEFNDKLYVSVGPDGNIYHTVDGITWEWDADVTPLPSVQPIRSLKEFDGYLYAGTGGPSYNYADIYRSSDGITWESIIRITGVRYIYTFEEWDGYLYAGTSGNQTGAGRIYRSSDGTHWTLVKTFSGVLGTDQTVYSLKGYLSSFILAAVGSSTANAKIYRSTDGITWSSVFQPGGPGTYESHFWNIEEHLGIFFVGSGGTHGKIWWSIGGASWDSAPAFMCNETNITALKSIGSYLYAAAATGGANPTGKVYRATSGLSGSWADAGNAFDFNSKPVWSFGELDSNLYMGVKYDQGKIYSREIVNYLHYMSAYNGASWTLQLASAGASKHDPAAGDVLAMQSYEDNLYAVVSNAANDGISRIKKYDADNDTWDTMHSHKNSGGILNTMGNFLDCKVYKNYLVASTTGGTIYYLSSGETGWKKYRSLDIGNSSAGARKLVAGSNRLWGMVPYDINGWYGTSFFTAEQLTKVYPPLPMIVPVTSNVSIPGYRKQLDFMIESAVAGGTLQGINRAVNAFTLVTPDIYEKHDITQWKLSSVSGSISQVSTNVWQFDNFPSWQLNKWLGAHATLVSGSAATAGTKTGTSGLWLSPDSSPTGSTLTSLPLLVDGTKDDKTLGQYDTDIWSYGVDMGEITMITQIIVYDCSEAGSGLHEDYNKLKVYKSNLNDGTANNWVLIDTFSECTRVAGDSTAVGEITLNLSAEHAARYFKVTAYNGALQSGELEDLNEYLTITEIDVVVPYATAAGYLISASDENTLTVAPLFTRKDLVFNTQRY